ncbi:hypothetical protein D3C73_1072000 [compost metagenome]
MKEVNYSKCSNLCRYTRDKGSQQKRTHQKLASTEFKTIENISNHGTDQGSTNYGNNKNNQRVPEPKQHFAVNKRFGIIGKVEPILWWSQRACISIFAIRFKRGKKHDHDRYKCNKRTEE